MGYMKELDIRIRNGGDDAIAAACELTPRWIPVSERLPEPGVRVLVFRAMSEPYSVTAAILRHEGDVASDRDTTHWMPLPEPPEVA
jgi:hypothetical protein